MALADILDRVRAQGATLTVLNRTDPEPVQNMLENLFDGTDVAVTEARTAGEAPANLVVLEVEDGLAVSTLDEVRENVLLVNSDLYVTGTRPLEEVATPDAIAELSDLPFRVRGYPDTTKGKYMLIEISRYIEARAAKAGVGTLRSGFQALSRIEDEIGTSAVYERLAGTDLDVHVYGVPDAEPSLGLTVHGEDVPEIRDSWFVVYSHPSEPERSAALLALLADDEGANEWRGFWTYDSERVAEIEEYLATAY
ncbi:MAG: histidine kinase [Halobacteriales archaeon]|nr:histidine kinase [Halobacteriales archaeon]